MGAHGGGMGRMGDGILRGRLHDGSLPQQGSPSRVLDHLGCSGFSRPWVPHAVSQMVKG